MTNAMFAFWDAVIAPHLARAQPRTVLLVGGGDGRLVAALIEALSGWQATLHVADAAPGFDVDAARRLAADRIVLHRASPADAIGLLPVPDLLLLDADPNYYTVQRLLYAARAQAARLNRPYPLTLLAQTGWPHGRRDGYADPAAIPQAFRHPHEKAGLTPGHTSPTASFGLFTSEFHAVMENEPRNGVLTALEDFTACEAAIVGSRSLPFLHGIGLIYPVQTAGNAASRSLIDAFAMGHAARHLAEAAEQMHAASEASAADLRRALHSERYQNKLLQENLRGARAVPEAAAQQKAVPGIPQRAKRKAIRAARLAKWAASGQLAARRSAENHQFEEAARIARLRESPAFDGGWYLRHYPDVASIGEDPAAHYYRHGAKEGRDPGPHFSAAFYLANNPDVAESGANPLLHYLGDGAREGRDPSPDFSSAFYLAHQKDVAEAGHNPLEHYLASGMAEGRQPREGA